MGLGPPRRNLSTLVLIEAATIPTKVHVTRLGIFRSALRPLLLPQLWSLRIGTFSTIKNSFNPVAKLALVFLVLGVPETVIRVIVGCTYERQKIIAMTIQRRTQENVRKTKMARQNKTSSKTKQKEEARQETASFKTKQKDKARDGTIEDQTMQYFKDTSKTNEIGRKTRQTKVKI